MANFWGGFGQGFAPSFEKALDRRRAEEKRLAEIERLAEVAKQERLGRLIGYKGALGEEDFRGLLPESGRTPINPEVYPADSIWTGAGPLPRQYRSLEDVMGGMGKKDRIGLEMAAKLMLEKKLRDEGRAYESEKAMLTSEANFKKLLSTGAAGQAGEEGKKASVEGKGLPENPYANPKDFSEQLSYMSWAAAWNKNEAEKGTTKEGRTYAEEEATRKATEAARARRFLALGARSVYLATADETKLPKEGSLDWENYRKGRLDEQNLPDRDKALSLADFDANMDNVGGAFQFDIIQVYRTTHFGDDAPELLNPALLSNWASAERRLADLRELDFLQKQYERIIYDPKLAKVAKAEGYSVVNQKHDPTSVVLREFFTNPKDLELAIRRIYGIFDAEAEKRRRGDDVPYEYYNHYDKGGLFTFRTWRLKAEAPEGAMRPSKTFLGSRGKKLETDADRWIKRANDGLAYEAMTFEGKDMVPIRRINAVDVEGWIRREKAGQRLPTTEARGGGPLPMPTPTPTKPEATPPGAINIDTTTKYTPEQKAVFRALGEGDRVPVDGGGFLIKRGNLLIPEPKE